MSISVSQDFRNGYINSILGTGAVSYNSDGSILNVKSPSGSNSCMKKWRILIKPGDEITVEVLARNLKGKTRIAIDLFSDAGNQLSYSYVDIDSSEFKPYKQIVKVPYDKEYNAADIVFGVPSSISDDTEGEFTLPKIGLKSGIGELQTIAVGLIRITNGVPTVNTDYKNFGIKSLTYDDVKKEILVTIDNFKVQYGALPLLQATATTGTVYTAIAGSWNFSTFTFSISLTDGTSLISLADKTYYIWVEVKG